MGFSLGHQGSDSASYSAPDPMFISAVTAMAKGFPWTRFERFFEARPLINASVNDQIFLMRILVLQEMLCMDDKSTLAWVKNQMYLFAFLSPGHKPKIPSLELFVGFRKALDEANVLEPFRQRCQALIVKHSDAGVFQNNEWQFEVDSSFAGKAARAVEANWVNCPICQGTELSSYSPPEDPNADIAPWAACDNCGHAFKV
ncbi:hypothetical protein EOL70_14705 [Leucothrix sargassi]|nr:hypothetical protein EOL70_14705 [Leucothrix sargassi]